MIQPVHTATPHVVVTRLDRVIQATCESPELRLGSPGPPSAAVG
jgi:hypothetical protein